MDKWKHGLLWGNTDQENLNSVSWSFHVYSSTVHRLLNRARIAVAIHHPHEYSSVLTAFPHHLPGLRCFLNEEDSWPHFPLI